MFLWAVVGKASDYTCDIDFIMASKQSSAVLISGGFVACQQEINEMFRTEDIVELRAKGSYI